MALRPPPAVRQDGRSGAFGPLRSRSTLTRSEIFGLFRSRSASGLAKHFGSFRRSSAPPFSGNFGRERLGSLREHSAVRKDSRSPQQRSGVNLVDFCGQTIRDDGLIINSHRDSRRYYFVATGTDCSLTMQAASPKDKVRFQFRFFLVYSLLRLAPSGGPPPNATRAPLPPETARPSHRGPGQPSSGGDWELQDPCNAGSYVQFYDGRGRAAEPLGFPLCGKSIPRPILSTGNYLTLRLVTRGQQPRVDFVGDFTSFRLGEGQRVQGAQAKGPCQTAQLQP
ncbi:Low-density lipoprotein receptor class A domain-containing protein 2 [Platysternon megacephalum]|uniref:Low-density lipoprotein receptor class A domain-containing protein 2 n=1 Tax=Platysternon megacephalum TaxID=55544 RepID=A0A4D9DQM0_9SAUR|nr:Low-density lipoprotein receptor class A domain-containing protein 2 [Platysternon megacephalum]